MTVDIGNNSRSVTDDEGHEIDAINRRRLMKYMGATGIVASLAGCSGGGSTDNKSNSTQQDTTIADPQNIPKGGVYKAATTNPTNGLNVFRIGDGETSARVNLVMEGGFVREGPKYDNFLPLWFEDMKVNDSNTEVEIKLRKNLKFGEGYGQLTAEDYLWNIENIWKADWAAFTYANEFLVGQENKPIEFKKVDKYTIRETIPSPRPFFPYNEPLSYMMPIPKEIAQSYVKKKDAKGLEKDDKIMRATFNGNLGPWDLKEWRQQSVMSFTRADDYYLRKWAKKDDRVPEIFAEAPFFDEVHYQYFDKRQSALQALQAGEIDRSFVPVNKVNSYKNKNKIELYKNPYRAWSGYLGVNQRANGWTQLRNRKVRHALAHVYNNNFIVKNLLSGMAGVQNTLYPSWGQYSPKDPVTFEGSLKKAKKLLKEGTSSEYKYKGDKLVGPNGNQVSLTVVYESSQMDDLRASYLKKRLGKVGIKLNQKTTSWTSLLSNYGECKNPAKGISKSENIGYGKDGKEHPSGYNYGPRDKAVSNKPWDFMLTLGFSYGPLTPAGTIANLFGKKGNFNMYGNDPDKNLEMMRDKAQTAKSRKAAKQKIQDMLMYLSKDRTCIWEYNPHNYYAYRKPVQGYGNSPPEDYWARNLDATMGDARMYFAKGKSSR
ncbi:ABC transporter substrate-binding protein [Haladaptatus sp. CMAA 1911]|uniref:ABC transporter substrate-binding protein n=1 Tax=unclassified Haladaptatus TaxID=2622732 RepID=UPI0037547F7D